MSVVKANRFVALKAKAKVKAEMQRRNQSGSVAGYGGSAYDYTDGLADRGISPSAKPSQNHYKEIRMTTAAIILEQLGGNKFVVMTGSHHFVSDGDTLRMQLRRNRSGANRLSITLDRGSDTYTMRFFYYRAGKINL